MWSKIMRSKTMWSKVMQAKTIILLCGLFLGGSIGLFLLLNFELSIWQYILQLRLVKLLGLITIASAVAVATLLFQTITQNNILTPSILGFDALFILLQTSLIWILGASNFIDINPYLRFICETSIMIFASFLLFFLLLKQSRFDLIRMILVGVIFSVLFRSASSFLHRVIDPNDFLVLQAETFASFSAINNQILFLTSILTIILIIYVWRHRFVLDIMMLGREKALNLGVNYNNFSYKFLIIIAILTSISTALVGPVNFLGLLVIALVNKITVRFHHNQRLILAILVGSSVLVLGQAIFENLFSLHGTLSIVVDLCGGIVFLWLLFIQQRKANG